MLKKLLPVFIYAIGAAGQDKPSTPICQYTPEQTRLKPKLIAHLSVDDKAIRVVEGDDPFVNEAVKNRMIALSKTQNMPLKVETDPCKTPQFLYQGPEHDVDGLEDADIDGREITIKLSDNYVLLFRFKDAASDKPVPVLSSDMFVALLNGNRLGKYVNNFKSMEAGPNAVLPSEIIQEIRDAGSFAISMQGAEEKMRAIFPRNER